jgi:predicted aspartyl protease
MHKNWEGSTCWSTTGRSGPVEIFFLIDTGCSQTALTKSTINYLINNGIRVTKTGSGWYNTACGLREFDEYEIQSITLGGITFKNLPIGAVDGDDNLLGMDILSAFGTLEFNLEQKTLVLK